MIKTITVTNYLGESLTMELTRPEKSGFAITNIDGISAPVATINVTEVSTNDGGWFNSARQNTRNIVMDFLFVRTATETIEDIRHKSYKFFPTKQKVTLLFETDNRVSEIEGYVEENNVQIFSESEGCHISIICPYPYLYSAGEPNTVVFYGVDAAFEFPFSNESLTEPLLEFGIIHKNTEQVIKYDGDAEIGITIVMKATGDVKNIKIYNISTRETMFIDTDKIALITGSSIIDGDEITVCTVKGQKSITLMREGRTYNILNCLNRDVDWFQLSKGDNVFSYTCDEGDTNLQFVISNRVIYEGV